MTLLLTFLLIPGRLEAPLYRIDSSWPLEARVEEIQDTRQPIAAFHPDDLKVTIHNFPFKNYEQSIPPQAQIQRWIGQLKGKPYEITPTSHSGFVGFILESEGMIAAAFQLSPYYRARLQPSERCADWTLKATGNIQKYRAEILRLIDSFELIGTLE